VEFVPVDLIAAEHKQAPYLARNPSGVVPALERDDGTLISQSTAITEFLDNLDGHPIRTGRTPRDKALVLRMQRRAEAFVLDPVGLYFHHATPAPRARAAGIQETAMDGPRRHGPTRRAKARAGMQYVDGILSGQPWLAAWRARPNCRPSGPQRPGLPAGRPEHGVLSRPDDKKPPRGRLCALGEPKLAEGASVKHRMNGDLARRAAPIHQPVRRFS
jgi:hypothetical protein